MDNLSNDGFVNNNNSARQFNNIPSVGSNNPSQENNEVCAQEKLEKIKILQKFIGQQQQMQNLVESKITTLCKLNLDKCGMPFVLDFSAQDNIDKYPNSGQAQIAMYRKMYVQAEERIQSLKAQIAKLQNAEDSK